MSIIPVVITPFTESGKLYAKGFDDLYSYLSDYSVSTLFVGGSYAAFALMTREMRIELAQRSTEAAHRHSLESIFNIGSSSFDESAALIEALGGTPIEAFATLAPYYYSNAGVYSADAIAAYLLALTRLTPKPLYFYNNPKTTGIDLGAEQLRTLAATTGIAGIKDSTSDLSKLVSLASLCDAKGQPVPYIPGSTLAMLFSSLLRIGPCMSGIFLSFPQLVTEIRDFAHSGDMEAAAASYKKAMTARSIMGRYAPRAVSAYYVLAHKGIDVGFPKFPWPRLDRQDRTRLVDDLRNAGLL